MNEMVEKKKQQRRNQSHLLIACLFFELFANAQTALHQIDREFSPQMKTIAQKQTRTLMNVFIGSPHKTYWLKQRSDYSYELCVLKSTATTAATIKWIYVFAVCAVLSFVLFHSHFVGSFISFQCTRIHTAQFKQTHVFSLHIICSDEPHTNRTLCFQFCASVFFYFLFLDRYEHLWIFCSFFYHYNKNREHRCSANVYDVESSDHCLNSISATKMMLVHCSIRAARAELVSSNLVLNGPSIPSSSHIPTILSIQICAWPFKAHQV